MKSTKNTGRIAGVLLLITIVAGGMSLDLRGLSTSLTESENFLKTIFENSVYMKLSIILDLVAIGSWVGISVMLFPILKLYSKSMALWFFGFWLISFSISIFGNITHLSLISLSQEFMKFRCWLLLYVRHFEGGRVLLGTFLWSNYVHYGCLCVFLFAVSNEAYSTNFIYLGTCCSFYSIHGNMGSNLRLWSEFLFLCPKWYTYDMSYIMAYY